LRPLLPSHIATVCVFLPHRSSVMFRRSNAHVLSE
jgi:hypothetical protein